jgi:hypothetical protein
VCYYVRHCLLWLRLRLCLDVGTYEVVLNFENVLLAQGLSGEGEFF